MCENKICIEDVFEQDLIDEISDLTNNYNMQDLVERENYISEFLSQYRFMECGFGTNRVVFEHEDYPDVVFKVAIDERGILDNNKEFELSKKLPHNIIAVCYESNGFISIQEKVEVFTKIDMQENINTVMAILVTLGNKYILNDVGYKAYKNWGIDASGNIVCLDYAYLTLISDAIMTLCPRCGGKLNYTRDMTAFRCEDCDALVTFSDISNTYDSLDIQGFVKSEVEDFNNDGVIDEKEFEKAKEEIIVKNDDTDEKIIMDEDGFIIS